MSLKIVWTDFLDSLRAYKISQGADGFIGATSHGVISP